MLRSHSVMVLVAQTLVISLLRSVLVVLPNVLPVRLGLLRVDSFLVCSIRWLVECFLFSFFLLRLEGTNLLRVIPCISLHRLLEVFDLHSKVLEIFCMLAMKLACLRKHMRPVLPLDLRLYRVGQRFLPNSLAFLILCFDQSDMPVMLFCDEFLVGFVALGTIMCMLLLGSFTPHLLLLFTAFLIA